MRLGKVSGVAGWAALLTVAAAANASAAEPKMQQFQFLIGQWTCVGHFVANGAEIRSTMAFSYDEPTATLIVRHDDLAPNKYHAVELWGASNPGDEYRNSIGDAYTGIRWFSSPGFVGDALSWTRNDKSGAPAERFTYLRKGSALTIEWWTAKAGAALTLGDTLDCQRST